MSDMLINEDVEMSILSSVLFDKEAATHTFIEVEAEDFYYTNYRTIFRGMLNLFQNNVPIELVSLVDILTKIGKYDEVGGLDIVRYLAGYVSTSANIRHYIRLLHEMSNRRKILMWAENLIKAAQSNGNYSDLCQMISDIPTLNKEKKEIGTGEIIRQSVERILDRYKEVDRSVPGLETGFDALDSMTGGIKNGEIIFILAEPNVGKSIFVQQILFNFARNNKIAAYFNFEMNDSQIGDRLVTMAVPLDTAKVKFPKQNLKEEDFIAIQKSNVDEELEEYFFIFSKTNKTITDIRARCKELMAKGKKPDVVGIDYIQLMQGKVDSHGKAEEPRLLLEKNSMALKIIAQEFDCPVLVISSLNRGGTIRNSGQLEFDADQIWSLEREHNSGDRHTRCTTGLNILKNRDGGKGEIALVFSESVLSFS